jgi:succinyl-diaminopimelate desuccinylase
MTKRDELLQLTKELILFRTTADRPDGLARCADFIATYLDKPGITLSRYEFGGIPSVVARIGSTSKHAKVMLCGHFDVIEGTDQQFQPHEANGRLIGRGALDMKSGLAALLTACIDLRDAGVDASLMLTGDEEIGGMHGVNTLLAQEGYSCDIALIPDGGRRAHHIVLKEKGMMRVKLVARGISCHASRMWQGDNAIVALAQAICAVQEIFLPVSKHPNDHWTATLNVGQIRGGLAYNQVPDYAEAVCDIRFTEHDSTEEICERMKQVVPAGVEVIRDISAPVVFISPEDKRVRAYAEEIARAGRTPVFTVAHGGSDARFFAARGTPVIISQPDGGQHHAADEWVDIDSIELYYRIVKSYVERVARV